MVAALPTHPVSVKDQPGRPMSFYADLHVHSKYSRATSRELDFFHLALWAKKKGITVVGTGDFTHPAWMAAIKEELVPAEPGLFRLRDDLEAAVAAELGPCAVAASPVRFLLEVEISTIYKQGDRVRKVHHLLYAPDLASADRMVAKLARIGNLASDGRPILGLNSRDLLEICLSSGDGCHLIPAHIWTPWFSVFGSKSGFDVFDECYGDLSGHIFAVETGLSSDPPMNWRLSALDRFRLVSNSDAHSPGNLGREACRFDCALDYFSMKAALETGRGFAGTVEFYPEEGKYHLDGHRACDFRCPPEESRRLGNRCPVCGAALTIGVLNRVLQLADRQEEHPPVGAGPFHSLVPLPEVLGELARTGAKSKTVRGGYERLIARLGSELTILGEVPLDDVGRAGNPLLMEAIRRLRAGQVIREGGFDGEYGVIRLFERDELEQGKSIGLLFDLPEASVPRRHQGKAGRRESGPAEHDSRPAAVEEPASTAAGPPTTSPHLAGLDPDQCAAAAISRGAVVVIAGPGTGKTRTLTHRIAHLVADLQVAPTECLAITFTRRAAGEMRDRLAALLADGAGEQVPVMTFHALGLTILREQECRLGLGGPLRVAGEAESRSLAREVLGLSAPDADRIVSGRAPRPEAYERALHERGWVDFDDLIGLAARVLEANPELANQYRRRWPHVSVDEFQDIDAAQYRLLQLLVSGPEDAAGSVLVIGDPDQSIYGFRGADVNLFGRFREDHPETRVVALTRNYRSTRTIVEAALQAIAPASLVRNRILRARTADSSRVTLRECATDRAEAEFVVETIERLVGGTSLSSFDTGRVRTGAASTYAFNDFAVLYRTDAQTPPLVEALARSGIPFQKRSHTALADHPTVRALLERMKALSAPDPLAGRLEAAAAQLAATDRPDPDLRPITDALRPLAAKHAGNLDALASELALGVDVDLFDPRAERVSLLTLHAAKGLEFRVVFLVGCEDGLLPHRFGFEADPPEKLAEERRLFFVGLTRAREQLLLSHARRRHWRGQVRERTPSAFLRVIRASLLDRQKEDAPAVPRGRQLNLFS